MPIVLLYHDVVAREHDNASGIPGAGAARYKLTPDEFRSHVDAVAAAVKEPPLILPELLPTSGADSGWMLTFDDGGVSALTPTADILENKGWRGHFFITTDFIDTPSFLSRQQIRELRQRGHVIGSHSCSHPERMSFCSWEQIVREWRQSRAVLEDILGESVTTASVPGGFYSRAVALAAAEAGLKFLFNSEPTTSQRTIGGCVVLGRYGLVRGMSAYAAAALARGDSLARLRQALAWHVRKVAKASGGRLYIRLREWLLRRRRNG